MLGLLIQLRERFEAQINRMMPEPQASFLAGLLTGSRRGMPEEVLKDYDLLTHYRVRPTSLLRMNLNLLPLTGKFLTAEALAAYA